MTILETRKLIKTYGSGKPTLERKLKNMPVNFSGGQIVGTCHA